jgi:hypothetical protein
MSRSIRSALRLRSTVRMAEDSNAEEEWPPPGARLRGILWRAEAHLERQEFVAAALALEEGFGLGDEALLRALYHLAAAGHRAQTGDVVRARRQLEHATRRLVSLVERAVESPRGGDQLA